MKKVNWLLFLSCLFMSFTMLTACEDDDKFEEGLKHPVLGAEDPMERSVKSESKPQKGQKHRSSDDFSTKGMNSQKLLWTCPDGITFDVNINKSGKDDVWASNLFNMAITDLSPNANLYIADPKGANESFTITYRVFEDNPNYIYITSLDEPEDGQKHRSSENFNLKGSTLFQIECTDKDASFDIWQDLNGSDKVIFSDLKDGAIIQNPGSDHNLYIADPDADNAFMVTFKPYESNPDYIYVTSSKSQLEGQSNRSSANFDLNKGSYYRIECSDADVKFSVWEDITGSDAVIADGIKNGDVLFFSSTENLYIANPSGANSSFVVTFIPENANNDYIYVTSLSTEQDGQKNRSSENFSKAKGCHDTWLVQCPEGVSFNIMWDRTTDYVTYSNVKNGSIINYKGGDEWYIANPSGASGSFTVVLQPYYSSGVMVASNAGNYDNAGDYKHNMSNWYPFSLVGGKKYRVDCPAGVKFNLIGEKITPSNYPNGSPTYSYPKYKSLQNGSVFTCSPDWECNQLYVSSPSGADGIFLVTFNVVEVEAAWMSGLSDNLYLYDLSIPGTHDSCTGTIDLSTIPNKMAQCQNTSIAIQLEHGIRYFDIRVDENQNIKHGSIDCDVDFGDVMNDFKSYLQRYPKEVILMELSNVDDFDLESKLSSYLNDNIMYTGSSIPTLGQARGKVVLFSRYPNATKGIKILSIWPDDGVAENAYNGNNYFYIEDKYYAMSEAIHDTKDKTEKVKDAITSAIDNPNDKKMYIIFNSVAGRLSAFPWDYAWGNGDKINPIMNISLSETLKEHAEGDDVSRPLRVGVIALDFYNKHGDDDSEHLVERIINLNFTEPFMSY